MDNKIPPWMKKPESAEFSCDIFPRCFYQGEDDPKDISNEKEAKSNQDFEQRKYNPRAGIIYDNENLFGDNSI